MKTFRDVIAYAESIGWKLSDGDIDILPDEMTEEEYEDWCYGILIRCEESKAEKEEWLREAEACEKRMQQEWEENCGKPMYD